MWAETVIAGYWSDNAVLMTEPSLTLTFHAAPQSSGRPVTAQALRKSLQMNRWASSGHACLPEAGR